MQHNAFLSCKAEEKEAEMIEEPNGSLVPFECPSCGHRMEMLTELRDGKVYTNVNDVEPKPPFPALTAPGTSYPPLAEADAEQDSSGKRYPHTEPDPEPRVCPKCGSTDLHYEWTDVACLLLETCERCGATRTESC